MEYSPEYYLTPSWEQRRRIKLESEGYKCENCGMKFELHIHHKHYKTFGNETLEDLQVLCHRCHNDYHFSKDMEKQKQRYGESSD